MEQSAPGDQIPFDDVKNEIFDMVKPTDPSKITCHDLIKRLVLVIYIFFF